jgi:hypothetical protein
MAARVLDHQHIGRVWHPWHAPLSIQKDRATSVQAVIEVSYSPSGELPRELLRQAYVASQFGTIVFVLAGPTAPEIDRVLDDLVLRLPLDIPGVRYVDRANETSIIEFVVSAEHVFAPVRSGTLRPMAAQWGCDVRTLSAARLMFDRKTRRARYGGTLPRHL